MPKRIIYEKGELIGSVSFIEEMPYKLVRRAKFLCLECGSTFITRISYVKCGDTKSCGCLKHKKGKNKTHGDTSGEAGVHYIYETWAGIKKRCFSKNCKAYKNYGGRGITVYEPWINDYVAFKKWILGSIGDRPRGMSLDRINNNGNYEPNNLRWATRDQQIKNSRTQKLSDKDEWEIYWLKRFGFETKELAPMYGVANTTICRIARKSV